MSKRSSGAPRRRRAPLAAASLVLALMAGCTAPPERRIEDPDCEYCYELESGVKYKTFEYYDP